MVVEPPVNTEEIIGERLVVVVVVGSYDNICWDNDNSSLHVLTLTLISDLQLHHLHDKAEQSAWLLIKAYVI